MVGLFGIFTRHNKDACKVFLYGEVNHLTCDVNDNMELGE
jgi:hypothetical protein